MIKKIKLKNFRIFDDATFDINNPLVIFSGKNAVGKTSILESIFLCSTSKSHRENDLVNLIKNDSLASSCEIVADKSYRVVISMEEKSYFINKTLYKRISDFIGDLKIVMFSPEDLSIIDGAKLIKRRFLDLEISLYDKEYLKNLSLYKKVLNERNNLLKEEKIDKVYLNLLTDDLAKYLSVVYKKRIEFIDVINNYLKTICDDLKIKNICLEYYPSYDPNDISKSLKGKIDKDILNRNTNIGCHRDYFIIKMDDKDSSIYSSNGEKHLICIAIKLAIKQYITTKCNEEPILLLDDIYQALDKEKIKKITEYIKKSKQAIITTTSIIEIPDEILKDALVLRIENK